MPPRNREFSMDQYTGCCPFVYMERFFTWAWGLPPPHEVDHVWIHRYFTEYHIKGYPRRFVVASLCLPIQGALVQFQYASPPYTDINDWGYNVSMEHAGRIIAYMFATHADLTADFDSQLYHNFDATPGYFLIGCKLRE